MGEMRLGIQNTKTCMSRNLNGRFHLLSSWEIHKYNNNLALNLEKDLMFACGSGCGKGCNL